MKVNDALFSQFNADNPLQFVIERDGAECAFNDLQKNGFLPLYYSNKNNPYLKNSHDFFTFRFGYQRFVNYYQAISKTLSETKTTHQRKNAFGGIYAR